MLRRVYGASLNSFRDGLGALLEDVIVEVGNSAVYSTFHLGPVDFPAATDAVGRRTGLVNFLNAFGTSRMHEGFPVRVGANLSTGSVINFTFVVDDGPFAVKTTPVAAELKWRVARSSDGVSLSGVGMVITSFGATFPTRAIEPTDQTHAARVAVASAAAIRKIYPRHM